MKSLIERHPAGTADLYDPDASNLQRRLANAIRLGTVARVDYVHARVRIQMGTILTDWLPWVTHRAGPDVTWWAPELAEQVVVLSPYGDLGQGIVLGAVYRNAFPAPEARETIHYTKYADGTEISYDRAARKLVVNAVGEVDVLAATKVVITAPEIDLVGHVKIAGNVDVTGNITATGTVLDSSGNTNHHSHP